MGKLILGIIGVFCLQLLFIAYLVTDRAADTTVVARKTVPTPSTLELASVNEIPQAVASPAPTTAAIAGSQRSILRKPALAERHVSNVRTSQKARDRSRPVRETARRAPSVDYASTRKPFERQIPPRPERTRVLIPSGYTMALVDYPVHAAITKTMDSPKQKKRSYIARVFPALVKKPWNFIKSIASKLD